MGMLIKETQGVSLRSFSSVLTIVLLFSSVDAGVIDGQPACEDPCPAVDSVHGWSTTCEVQYRESEYIPVSSSPFPAAPSSLGIVDVKYKNTVPPTLGLEISWGLPSGNVSGLSGFSVCLLKTNAAGSEHCKAVNFIDALPDISAPDVKFTFKCWTSVDIDSQYAITVTSLHSGHSVTRHHRTTSCFELSGFGLCSSNITSKDDWRAANVPRVILGNDLVNVIFDVYPGDFWLTYKVNLFDIDKGRSSISKVVNTNGSSGVFTTTFSDVPPGRYRAEVFIWELDVDPILSRSIVFTINETKTIPQTSRTLQTEDPSHDVSSEVSKRVQGQPLNTGVSNRGNNEVPQIVVGVVGGVVIGVLLVGGLVAMWKKRHMRSPGYQPHHGNDGSFLVNNIERIEGSSYGVTQCNINDFNRDNQDCGVSDIQGSLWTYSGVHMVEGVYPDFLLEQDSVNASQAGISV